jgi:hypothetical protein
MENAQVEMLLKEAGEVLLTSQDNLIKMLLMGNLENPEKVYLTYFRIQEREDQLYLKDENLN